MRLEKKYDVVFLGGLAGNDLIFAGYLASKGWKCCVLCNADKEYNQKLSSTINVYNKYESEFDILKYRGVFHFIALAKNSYLLVSFTGAIVGALKYVWFFRNILGLPPIINIMTGADMSEMAPERSLRGYLYRQHLKFVDISFFLSYPHVLKNIFSLKLSKFIFLEWPFHLVPSDIAEIPFQNRITEKSPVYFIHSSHLDWGVNDSKAGRNSTKGNDKFIRAFARAISNGFDGYCIIIDRGPDKETAKELIKKLGVQDRFIWKNHLAQQELFEEFKKADVVVDQFDIGGFGGIAREAIALAKPLMIYINENCIRLTCSQVPPVMNCSTEEEIYQQILKCKDKTYLREIGIKLREWARMNDNWYSRFVFYYSLLTGRKMGDYGFNNRE